MVTFFKANKRRNTQPLSIDSPLLIDSYSDDGRGVARYQGKTVFVRNALLGEQVFARVEKNNTRFIEAVANKIEIPSTERVKPDCRYFGKCGGCSLQHMSISEQHSFKQESFLRQLKHTAGIQPKALLPILSKRAYQYRQRCRLAVLYDSKGVVLGFRQLNQKQVVNVENCAILHPALNGLIPALRSWLGALPGKPVTHVELVNESQAQIIVRHTRALTNMQRQALIQKLEPHDAQCWFQDGKNAPLKDSSSQAVEAVAEYSLDDTTRIRFHPQGFIQANASINQAMVKQAIQWLAPQRDEVFMDLFCGAGNFSLPLSKLACKVLGFEGVESAVKQAQVNAQLNARANVEFYQADLFCEDSRVFAGQPMDGMILDPPRAGAQLVCEQIGRWNPKRLVYVSCNPGSFARDAHILCKSGYVLEKAGLLDMYPQSSHSEVMGLFAR